MATTKATTLAHNAEIIDDLGHQSVPHIIPGVLYPAYVASGTSPKLLDGTTTHGTGTYNGVSVSTAYGTVQADGRKYYYTNIAGSKPIKDPRIGAHFGSQRHKTKSLQLLEQETATHGADDFSADGREWLRLVGGSTYNSSAGNYVGVVSSTTSFVEVVGYFSGVNLIAHPDNTNRHYEYKIDGGGETSFDTFEAGVDTPLGSRYVDAGSVLSVVTGQTLGIHTFKIRLEDANDKLFLYGIELIAQDITSTANRSKIQIPSQNVVSYGKKFTVSAEGSSGHHYNPFNNQAIGDNASHGKNTVGWTTYDSTLDTATSLGLAAWVDSGNYYRPVNGGRVVKWVDSSGNIKTSVNMMPPSAKALGSQSGNSGPHQTAWTSTYQPVFSSGSVDHTQAEVAKTYLAREFGNGGANGSGSYKDATIVNSDDNIAYVLDDGTTSLSAEAVALYNGTKVGSIGAYNDDYFQYLTFIGTGLSFFGKHTQNNIASNLPYGTHTLYINHGSGQNQISIDGVQLYNSSASEIYYSQYDFTFYQPKKPPIPEDAVVLCDYMLMADFVAIANDGTQYISKGVRLCSTSRDAFFETGGGSTWTGTAIEPTSGLGGMYQSNSGTDNDENYFINEFFGSNAVVRMYDTPARVTTTQVRTGSGSFTSVTPTKSGSGYGAFAKGLTPTSLGNNATKIFGASGQWFTPNAMEFATPIHTSSHYQSFETPFLHELVGGDRNMEQHNLVVSPDGKTWDEVTRDTSYMGNQCISTASPTDAQTQDKHPRLHTRWRGTEAKSSNWRVKTWLNKDFAIANDRVICLKDGNYRFQYTFRVTSSVGAAGTFGIILNDATTADASVTGHIFKGYHSDANQVMTLTGNYYLKRGDVISWQGPASDITQDTVQIERVK